MLYEKNREKSLPLLLFQNPTSEYRGAPFWSWNCALTKELLGDQIEIFKQMGFGGFHMHPRAGLVTPYLSDEFMDMVKFCVDKAKSEEMLAYLYDEDRWPSGFAGGLVTKDEKYRAKYLRFTTNSYKNSEISGADIDLAAKASKSKNGRLLCCYDVTLDENGCLKEFKTTDENAKAQGIKWYAYLETPMPSPKFNDQTYVNTLEKEAIDRFKEITYEAYKEKVGDDFGGAVPSIFTDEPQFSHKTVLSFPDEKKDVVLPWTDNLNETFSEEYGDNLLSKLPELIWELPDGKVSVVRYNYHDHVTERFAQAFADNLGKWCDENGLLFTGHMMAEENLRSQTLTIGEAMRSYRSFGLPGIDMLCNYFEYTTAKQAQSASHQFGNPGVLSELYGVTGWHFDFRGHKIQGDWQAALGVTTRVHHLSWTSMAGEAKRDYPASINYQSPWFKEYRLIENHFARVNTALTRGKAVVRVGVIHPIESYWMHWGPESQTRLKRDQIDENFHQLAQWLLLGSIDFDYICESLLPIQCEKASAPLQVGEMSYDVIVVPGCETLRSTTLERLAHFKKSGGRLIFMGEEPKYLDALESDAPKALLSISEHIPFARADILQALGDVRQVELRDRRSGELTNNLIYQLRQDNDCRWLFIAHGKIPPKVDNTICQTVKISIDGMWNIELYDTFSGDVKKLHSYVCGGKTEIIRVIHNHDSVLLRLTPASEECSGGDWQEEIVLSDYEIQKTASVVPITLEEPNVLLLDYAEFALDGGEYEPSEEILRADNILRSRLGYAQRRGAVVQPWTINEEKPEHTISLRFRFNSERKIDNIMLAAEDAEKMTITFNGKTVRNDIQGYYVDKSIKTVVLGSIVKGENVLELTAPFGRRTNPEWCYILGDFGVKLKGAEKIVTEPVRELGFGDITSQGLPFYGGNIIYHLPVNSKGKERMSVEASHYRGALIGVYENERDCGKIVFAPYRLLTDAPESGIVDIKLFGNRANTFGPLHWCVNGDAWVGPNCWRTTDDGWTESYNLYTTGILSAPIIGLA